LSGFDFNSIKDLTANFCISHWNNCYHGLIIDVTEARALCLLNDLWVLQLPGLDGQELSLKLHCNGQLGSFEDSSGKY